MWSGSTRSITFTPDGHRAVFVSNMWDDPIWFWDVHLETRSAAEMANFVRQRVPWRVEDGRLVPTEATP